MSGFSSSRNNSNNLNKAIVCPQCMALHPDLTEQEKKKQQRDQERLRKRTLKARLKLPFQCDPHNQCSHHCQLVFVSADCPICLDTVDSPVVTFPCGHVVCKEHFEYLGGKVGNGEARATSKAAKNKSYDDDASMMPIHSLIRRRRRSRSRRLITESNNDSSITAAVIVDRITTNGYVTPPPPPTSRPPTSPPRNRGPSRRRTVGTLSEFLESNWPEPSNTRSSARPTIGDTTEFQEGVEFSIGDILTGLEGDNSVDASFVDFGDNNVFDRMWEEDEEATNNNDDTEASAPPPPAQENPPGETEAPLVSHQDPPGSLYEEMLQDYDSIDSIMYRSFEDDTADGGPPITAVVSNDDEEMAELEAAAPTTTTTILTTRRLFRPWRIHARNMR